MPALLIDGKSEARLLCDRLTHDVSAFAKQYHRVPGLAVVLVGTDPASDVYVRNKVLQTNAVGMHSFEYRLPADTSEGELLARIDELNRDEAVDGILVQLPLPAGIDVNRVIERIVPDKDVDGFTVTNAGRLATGIEALVPCTPSGVIRLLKKHHEQLAGLHALVIGASNIVGKPMARLLLQERCTVTIAHSKTVDIQAQCGQADILVVATGVPRMIAGDWIKPGATVIDVGISRIQLEDGSTRLVGDVDFEGARQRAGAITPVPGGVGPMTIACLLANTLQAAQKRATQGASGSIK
ncbi:bifunctional methylenetetrahydrofolate dehydrogenase/methenyltetrahydrofolate cyclohydrolase FolD [Pseudomonas aeruginosa]|uniref:bifunctional methylenetetrahydrofolate dehydrogenase/methenyltetrahydrofolate cyclohydrolase FolD n=1 Tax=Pseudomonas aeruginosa TaxID=287 RepID=UPI0007A9CC7A|nr:bifunctional methylenetetrahydrofolate dehydrogenase/methenyltetrahydrofolate cyclohydrolase FolD [Pseudomonas aeruginosa]SAJ30147.1 bifunctional 5%2C10-methylene-tetrahydrofolate dehydrogenase/ 5%2C10-methylene-tetrahydrofolate cyclohydrolase [Enterobacter cloacae]ELK4788220.1 bifunctional methylenetetrahydrofolate dehydrogenase/methenyltetrahydrofolate cyclohydrolase FolD [Pseudomonas aeruginosa]MBG6790983.1 bifunctional methylenetetrahydrofolate dehydrogenase/methenyltetrahydrofolate cyclo